MGQESVCSLFGCLLPSIDIFSGHDADVVATTESYVVYDEGNDCGLSFF